MKKPKKHIPAQAVTGEQSLTNAAARAAASAIVCDLSDTLRQMSAQPHAADPQGSYTGVPEDPKDPRPVQDADDL